jgi:hypothetical protein
MNKPKAIQPIAPAPVQGHHNQLSMAQINMAPSGMPGAGLTPVAMVSSMSMAGQPILISQASSMQQAQLGTPILAPMTFTLAPMAAPGIEVRQGLGAAMQQHQQQQQQQQHQQHQHQHQQQHQQLQLHQQHQLHQGHNQQQHQQQQQQHHHQHQQQHQHQQSEHILS